MQKLQQVEKPFGIGIPNMTATQVARTENKAIYRRWDGIYEVFAIKIKAPGKVFDNEYPERETYPSSEDFGSTAWCYADEKLAMERYNAIQP